MKRILDDNEWQPSFVSNRWKEDGDFPMFMKYKNCPKITYQITKELIDLMKEYNKLFKRAKKIKNTYKRSNVSIIKIYIIYDIQEPKNFYIGYTTRSVLYAVKMILHDLINHK